MRCRGQCRSSSVEFWVSDASAPASGAQGDRAPLRCAWTRFARPACFSREGPKLPSACTLIITMFSTIQGNELLYC
eukprot:4376916-Pleurochrysis_carterae.AAC.3